MCWAALPRLAGSASFVETVYATSIPNLEATHWSALQVPSQWLLGGPMSLRRAAIAALAVAVTAGNSSKPVTSA